MNLSPRWCDWFRQEGWECHHWSTIGDRGAPDRVLMSWAREHGFIVFTHDLDFGALLAATQATGPSVIQVRAQGTLPEDLATKLIPVFKQVRPHLEAGALVVVDEARWRVRILPLQVS